jgi:hypothetical protein
VYDKNNFIGRVNYAAHCFVRRSGLGGRHFAACFEMADGDAVITALIRRADKNSRLRAAILREFVSAGGDYPNSWKAVAEPLKDIPTRKLSLAAAEQRARFASQ